MISRILWTLLILLLIGGILWWFLRGRAEYRFNRATPAAAEQEMSTEERATDTHNALPQNTGDIPADLYCETNDDCTYYNASDCCGWTPVNVSARSSKDHQANTCTEECRIGIPTCVQNQCALVQ